MPNQRDPEKRMIGIYVSPKEYAQIKELARRLNTNMSELLRRLAANQADPIRKRTN
jgi:hypothetical protein